MNTSILKKIKAAVFSVFSVEQKLKTVSCQDYDVIVVSFGGAGTTMLLEFLAPYLKVNNRNSYVDGLKHIYSPEHPILKNNSVGKVIYLMSDPRDSVLSLFRRNYAENMMAKLKANHSSPEEYYSIVSENKSGIKKLSDFLEIGDDVFGFKEHWKQWTESTLTFPVLFINYETIHDSIKQILEFLELPVELENSFPPRRQRNSSFEALSSSDRTCLNQIYEEMATDIANRPGTFIRQSANACEIRKKFTTVEIAD